MKMRRETWRILRNKYTVYGDKRKNETDPVGNVHRTYEYGGGDDDVCDLESRWKMIILQLATCSRARLGFFVPIRCHSRFCPTCGVKYSQERSASMSFKLVNCMPTIDMVATGRNIMRLREGILC